MQKIMDSVHQESFSCRKSRILCTKKVFHAENHRFCAPKKFFMQKITDSVHQKKNFLHKNSVSVDLHLLLNRNDDPFVDVQASDIDKNVSK